MVAKTFAGADSTSRIQTRLLTPLILLGLTLWLAPAFGSAAILFSSDQSGAPQLYTVNPDGSGLVQITHFPGGAVEGRWSQDASRIALISAVSQAVPGIPVPVVVPQLFLCQSDGSGLQPWTMGPGAKGDPHWVPGSGAIVFHLDDSTQSLWQIPGPGLQAVRLPLLAGPARHPSIDPTGTVWAYQTLDGGFSGHARIAWGLWGGVSISVVPDGAGQDSAPEWDPSGTKLAFVHRDDTVGSQLWIFDRSAGTVIPLTSGAFHCCPVWAPDGQSLACSSFRGGVWSLALVTLAGAETNVPITLARPLVCDWR